MLHSWDLKVGERLTCDKSFGKVCAWLLCPVGRSALCCCCSCCCCAAASDLRSCLHLNTPIITCGHDKNRRLKKSTSSDWSTLRSNSQPTSPHSMILYVYVIAFGLNSSGLRSRIPSEFRTFWIVRGFIFCLVNTNLLQNEHVRVILLAVCFEKNSDRSSVKSSAVTWTGDILRLT